MMTDHPPPVLQRGCCVVIQGAALPLMYRSVLALIQRRHHDGVAVPPLARGPHDDLPRPSQPRHEDDGHPLGTSCSCGQDGDWISVAEAADLLHLEQATDAEARGQRYWRPPRSLDLGTGPRRRPGTGPTTRGCTMTTAGPTAYPASWRPAGARHALAGHTPRECTDDPTRPRPDPAARLLPAEHRADPGTMSPARLRAALGLN